MACGWWIKNIAVSGLTVSFYIGVSGNSWSISLKNSSGTIEASTSGSSYGNRSLTATTYDTSSTNHTLELTCNWSTTNPCETCPVNIPQSCTPNWQCVQPLNGYEHDTNNCPGSVNRLNPGCNPTSCTPNWVCRQPLDGYEHDANNCPGSVDRPNSNCNPTSCTPNWQCVQPLNGYEHDTNNCPGSVNRYNSSCVPTGGGGGTTCTPQPGEICLPGIGPVKTIYIIGAGVGLFAIMLLKR